MNIRTIIVLCFIFPAGLWSCKNPDKTLPEDPLQFVDPFICTEGDNGQLYPGASYPFGMVQLSPETEGDSHVGYYYEDEYIEGFSHLRIPGAGSKGKGGGLLVKPGIGAFTHKIGEFREKYDKRSEEASPGYYTLALESGVKAELTVSKRVGFHRYSFPGSQKENRYIAIDLSHSYVGMTDARLDVKNDHEITGMIESLHNSGGGYHRLYYAIVSDVPFQSYTSWKGDEVADNVAVREGNDTGIWLKFPAKGSDVIQLKVGLSPVSEEQAMTEATREIVGWDFENVKNETASVWRNMLAKAEVRGGSDEFKTLFYTHLYHSYLVPNISSSSAGTYRAANQPDSLYYTRDTAPDFDYYSTWSLWDDFRKYSLVSLLEPAIAQNIARSLVDFYKHRAGGDRKYWPTPNIRMEFTGAVILDAWNKGLRDFDAETALRGMKEDYEHTQVKNLSDQLEKAYHAYFALKMAEALEKNDEIGPIREEALAYRKYWCPEQKDNQGNIRGFFTPDAQPVPDVEEFEKYVYEGNLWHYRWFVLHDTEGLTALAGGKEKLSDDLEYFFEHDFYMHLNEPDIHAPFLFNLLGKPYLTQKWARAFTTKEVVQLYHNHGFFEKPVISRIYRTDPKGYIETMDDDAGAMSSWFVMSAMGLFPLDPVEPYYLIGSPVFPELTLHLDNGKKFTVIAHHVSEDHFYIQSATLNGQEFDRPWIDYNTIMAGGALELEMGPQPNKAWGSAPGNIPFGIQNSLPLRGLCAHRGAKSTHPENTVPAFEEAVRLGAAMIEFDVFMTKDGKLVLMHDKTVDRTTTGKGKVSELTFAEIRELDAGITKSPEFAGTKVPTFEEALSVIPRNTWINIHLKDSRVAAEVARILVAEKRTNQAFLACVPDAAAEAKKVSPEIKICNMDRQSGYIRNTIEQKCEFIQLTSPGTPEEMKQLKAAGVRINFFGVKSPEHFRELVAAGVDFPLVDDYNLYQPVAEEIGLIQ
jgi:putative alpha-1,2-mannosidase/glycerophosphoryl diester phosphodiesterase